MDRALQQEDVLLKIGLYCNENDLFTLRNVCKNFYYVFSLNSLWKVKCKDLGIICTVEDMVKERREGRAAFVLESAKIYMETYKIVRKSEELYCTKQTLAVKRQYNHAYNPQCEEWNRRRKADPDYFIPLLLLKGTELFKRIINQTKWDIDDGKEGYEQSRELLSDGKIQLVRLKSLISILLL